MRSWLETERLQGETIRLQAAALGRKDRLDRGTESAD